jgi:alkylation response protein AidB-like acyl-CoA dehydrogenase
MILSEGLSRCASFGATFGAQVNLVILPVSVFGTDDQKRRYLPRLLSGEIVGAYCLSEPASGSDALGAKTRATLEADGTFVLNGEKAWITNGGIADLFVVFAKVNGEHFSAFLVERSFAGLTTGREEHKMGLHGSSTTSVTLQNVRVPAANLLGDIGKGHKIAFGVLNFARFKLGATCAGSAVSAIGEAAQYAALRRQFGRSIASFGAIKHKIGEMVARTYAVESVNYRIAGLIDARLGARAHDTSVPTACLEAFEEHAIEASIAKVAGSEMLDFVLDENIQIHGGNGFVRDYPAERHYRDSRVNRIFEGTNEINRLLIPGLLARRAASGHLPLATAARHAEHDIPASTTPDVSALVDDGAAVARFKRATLLLLTRAMETYGKELAEEQEVLTYLADMLIDVYAADSAVLRARAALATGLPRASLHEDAARVFVNDAGARLLTSGRQVMAAIADAVPGGLRTDLGALLDRTPTNTVGLRRRIADEAVNRGGYPL